MHRKCSSWTLVVLSTSTALQRMHMHSSIYIHMYVCMLTCVSLYICMYTCAFNFLLPVFLSELASKGAKPPIQTQRQNQEVRMQRKATTHIQIQFRLRSHKYTYRYIHTHTCRSFHVVAGYHPVLWLPLAQLPATQSSSSSLTLSLARSHLACLFFWHIFMRSCVWSMNDIYVQFVTLAHVTCRLSWKCLGTKMKLI